MKRLMVAVMGAAMLLGGGISVAMAQQYGVPATLFSHSGTNIAPATATNVASAVTLTKYDGFELEIRVGLTNAATGTLDIQWDSSADGSNYPASKAVPGASGWFSVPLTNQTASAYWITNISVGSLGYWRVNWVTNNSGQNITQLVVKPYVKPRRDG